MQRRHAEDALAAGSLEVQHLQHDGQGLGNEEAAHDEEHDLLAHDHRDRAQRCAQPERADVAHEHFRRVGVEPQKTQAGATDRATKHRQLTRARDIRHAQILGEADVTRHIGKDRERTGNHHRRHDRQTIEAIGQVHRMAGAVDDEIAQGDETDHAQRIAHRLEEGHDQLGLRRGCGGDAEVDRRRQRDQRGPQILPAARQTLRITMHDLAPVIHPTHRTETEGDEQRHPDVIIPQVAPQQDGDAD